MPNIKLPWRRLPLRAPMSLNWRTARLFALPSFLKERLIVWRMLLARSSWLIFGVPWLIDLVRHLMVLLNFLEMKMKVKDSWNSRLIPTWLTRELALSWDVGNGGVLLCLFSVLLLLSLVLSSVPFISLRRSLRLFLRRSNLYDCVFLFFSIHFWFF